MGRFWNRKHVAEAINGLRDSKKGLRELLQHLCDHLNGFADPFLLI